MANKLTLKRSAVPGKVPTTTDLDLGEIAINTYDGKAYMKKNVSGVESIVLLVGAGSGDVTGPAASADNAIARFDGTSGKLVQNSSASIDDSGNISATSSQSSGTGANKMPVGTTAQRPTGAVGNYRFNSTTGSPEWYDATKGIWVSFSANYDVEILMVGGGGGGGFERGGGGGGGGVIYYGGEQPKTPNSSSYKVAPGTSYVVVVGAGGAGGLTGSRQGKDGGISSFYGVVSALGGGGGGAGNTNANSGGSGGGAGMSSSVNTYGGAGTSGQGNAGGDGRNAGDNPRGTGGGGGAGGGGGGGASAPNGGLGIYYSISGASTPYAGGGGGGDPGWDRTSTGYGTGGVGGGGEGGKKTINNSAGGNGTANTGGGGGGGGNYNDTQFGPGGSGGSGVVIVRYPGPQRATGGTITFDGYYTIHKFTSSGTFVA